MSETSEEAIGKLEDLTPTREQKHLIIVGISGSADPVIHAQLRLVESADPQALQKWLAKLESLQQPRFVELESTQDGRKALLARARDYDSSGSERCETERTL